ncbi:hypothetical protein [Streptosporangium sp. NPDC006007]|uniref:hypothetical protein n=1 Tax=Streptosporangium sp. NPDC006007 TaxID=3154575 RepID=UPI0033B4605C
MVRLIESLVDRIKVESGEFSLEDLDGASGQPEGYPSITELAAQASEESWFVTTANLAILTSPHTYHVVDVTLQLWDGPPPADESAGKKDIITTLFSSSGRLRLVQTLGRPSSKVMDLHGEMREWCVRAVFRPLDREPSDAYPPEGLEAYLLQFWPST